MGDEIWLVIPSGLVPEGLFKLADPRDSGWLGGPLLAHLSSPGKYGEMGVIDLIRRDSGSPGASGGVGHQGR